MGKKKKHEEKRNLLEDVHSYSADLEVDKPEVPAIHAEEESLGSIDLESQTEDAQAHSNTLKVAKGTVSATNGKENGHSDEFVPSEGLSSEEAESRLLQHGRNELEKKVTPKWLIYLKQLYGPMPIMIWIAIIIEAAIENWLDFAILLAIQFINATIGWYETVKAADAVAALKNSLKPHAVVKRDGTWQNTDAAILVPGDLVLLASGAAVPADCRVNGGQIDVDQSALTGESLPVVMRAGSSVKMGSTVTRGEVEATVEATGKHTFFGKTATMIQSVQSLGNLQKVLLKVMVVLLLLSFLLCGIAFIYLLSRGEAFKRALEFTVVLLVASIPIAIEIVCTTTLAIGARELSKYGAIVTRLVAIEELAGMNILCSDKTGTLTLNTMVIQDDCPTYQAGKSRYSVLQSAAMAAKWSEPPKDALDTMVLGAADLPALSPYVLLDHMPFDPSVKRTESTVKGPDGGVFKVTKGAPHIILGLVHNHTEIEGMFNETITDLGMRGIRALAVARSDEQGRWCLLGILTFLDPPRPDTKETIEKAIANGVAVKMITGDHQLIAKETARILGMGTNIHTAEQLPTFETNEKLPKDLHIKYGEMILQADGFAQVYPEHKFLIIETLRQGKFAVGMTGDGVNDAPALKRADVGIAVSGATDAAQAAADIVLTEPGLTVIVHAIDIARCIFQRVWNFFNYRIAATMQLLAFFFISVFAFNPEDYQDDWPSYFQLPVIMLMLITLLNDGTLISIAYDRVTPSPRPEKWNLKVLFLVSTVLGAVACGSSLLLLWAALDSHNPNGIFQKWGLPALYYGQVITMIYLKVSLSDFLTLFSARTRSFFFLTRPSWLLLSAALFSLGLSTLLACVWPTGYTDDIPAMGLTRGDYKLWWLWVWLYCLVWWFIQDLLKAFTYWVVYRFNICGANTAKLVNTMDAHDFNGSQHPLARVSAGTAEAKVIEMKAIDRAQNTVHMDSKMASEVHLARNSAEAGPKAVHNAQAMHDVEAGVQAAPHLREHIAEQAGLGAASPLDEPLDCMNTASENLSLINKQLQSSSYDV